MHTHDDVILSGVGVWQFRWPLSIDTGSTVSNSDGPHGFLPFEGWATSQIKVSAWGWVRSGRIAAGGLGDAPSVARCPPSPKAEQRVQLTIVRDEKPRLGEMPGDNPGVVTRGPQARGRRSPSLPSQGAVLGGDQPCL
jgi:hypothetical protein